MFALHPGMDLKACVCVVYCVCAVLPGSRRLGLGGLLKTAGLGGLDVLFIQELIRAIVSWLH